MAPAINSTSVVKIHFNVGVIYKTFFFIKVMENNSNDSGNFYNPSIMNSTDFNPENYMNKVM